MRSVERVPAALCRKRVDRTDASLRVGGDVTADLVKNMPWYVKAHRAVMQRREQARQACAAGAFEDLIDQRARVTNEDPGGTQRYVRNVHTSNVGRSSDMAHRHIVRLCSVAI